MAEYFKKFPTIEYTPAGKTEPVILRDITRRVRFVEEIRSNPYTFLPYTIEEGMSPEEVAFYYYGDARYVWLVHLANQVKDPYYEWPLDNALLDKVMAKKYESNAIKWWKANGKVGPQPFGMAVVQWTQRTDIEDNILHYENKDDKTLTVNAETYRILSDPTTAYIDPSFDQTEWEPLRFYEHELEQNESRRSIFLVNSDYRDQIEQELEKLINHG